MSKAAKTIQKIARKELVDAAIVLGLGLYAISELLSDKVTIPLF